MVKHSSYVMRIFQENEFIDILSMKKASLIIEPSTEEIHAIDFTRVNPTEYSSHPVWETKWAFA